MKRILLIIICIISITNTLQAQTTFVATADAFDWGTGDSWEGGVSPGFTINAGDTVIIPDGRSIVLSANALTNNGTIQLDGFLTIFEDNGTITNNGNISINGLMTYSQSLVTDGEDSIINNGVITVSGAIHQITNARLPKIIRVNPGGSFFITPTGSIGVGIGNLGRRFADMNIINDGFFENQGTIGRTRILTNLAAGTFENQGTVLIAGIAGGLPFPNQNLAKFTNHGTFINSGTFNSATSFVVDGVEPVLEHVNTGTFTVTSTGVFTMSGIGDAHTFTSASEEAGTSSFINDGLTTIGGRATFINGTFGDPEVDLLDNNNQFFIEPEAELINFGLFDTFVTFNNGTLTNRGTTNVDIFLNNGHLGNSGFFNLVGGGFNSDGSPNTIDNSGNIRVTSGSFRLNNTTMHVSRTLRVEFGVFTISENSTLTYDNTTAPNGVFWIFDIINFTVNGTLTIVEGTLINDAAITNNGTIDNQAFFINNAQFNNNGTFLNSGGMSQNEIPGATEVSRLDNFGAVTNTGVLLFNTRMNNFEGSITNSGTLTYNDGGANFGAAIITNTNTGEIAMNSGSITNREAATLDNFGAITINNATLNNQGLLNNSGAISHTGAFNNTNTGSLVGINTTHIGNFSNQASLSPGNTATSIGTYTLNNNYTHTTDATLNIEIESTTAFDNVAVTGTANLSGILNVTLPTGFVTPEEDTFTILTASSVSGTFDTTNLPSSSTQVWEINYNPTNVTLTVISICEVPVTFTAPAAICLNAGVQMDVSGGLSQGGTYAGPGVIDDGNGITYSFNPIAAGVGTHTLSYTFTDAIGCTDTASDTIEVFALPVITIIPEALICINAGLQTGLGNATPTGGVYSGPGVTDDGNGMTYSFDPAEVGLGTHTITYEAADTNGCTNNATSSIEVVALPEVNFTAPEDLPLDAGIQTGLSGGTPSVSMLSTTVTIVIEYEVSGFLSFIEGTIVFNSSGAMLSTDVTANNSAGGITTNLVNATALGATITLDFGNGSTGTIVAEAPIIGASGNLTFSGSNLVIDGDVFDFFSGTGTTTTPGTSIYSGPGVINNGNGATYSFDPAVAGVGTHIIEYTYTDANGCAVTASDTIEVFINPCDTTTTYTLAGGWDNGIPTTSARAVIAEDYNTSAMGLGDITACELIINTGVTLTVSDGNFIIVENNITINGILDVANTGSIVQIDENAVTINNGSIAVAKTTPIIDDRNFVAMSSPVTAEARDRVYGNSRAVFSIIPSNFVPFAIDFVEFPEFEFAENFLDDNNDYLLPVTGSTATPAAGIGQLIFPQPEPNVGDGAYTITYTQDAMNPGTLNSGTITVPINYNGPATTNNYNLLGNPYASAIDVTAFINANDAVNEVYYWDHITNPSSDLPGFGTSNFSMNDISIRNAMMGIAAVNGGTEPGQFMASGQGFGIKADQAEMIAGTPVVFTNSIRVTGNNDGFRNSETQTGIDKLWLNLTTTAFDEAIAQTGIGFTPDATPGIDKGYDSPRVGTFLSLFTTVASGELLGIQAREAFDADIEIVLGFSTSIEAVTSYTINIDTLEGIAIENATIFIIDHFLNTIVNLNEQSYTFTAQKGLHTDRFTMVFQDRDVLSAGEESFRESGINLYPNPSQGQVTLAYTGTATLENAVITDVNGKIIRRIDLTHFNQTQTIALDDLARGMYFMRITSQENTVIKKLMIR